MRERLGITMGLATCGLVLAVVALAGSSPSEVAADDGSDQARVALREMVDASCSETAFITYAVEAVHQIADASPTENVWLQGGLIFVGDLAKAAESIDGSIASQTAAQGWIILDEGAEGSLLHMAATITPRARTVWAVLAHERMSPLGC